MFKAVLKSNLKRYWWVFVLNTALLFLGYIVPILNDHYPHQYWFSIQPMLMFSGMFGVLNGWTVFAYMNSTKAVNLFHSLPSTRRGIFLGNICYGGLSALIPNLITAVLIPILSGKYEVVDTKVNFFYIFINSTVVALLFFAIACFTVMFSGSAVAGKVFTPIIIGLPFYLDMVFRGLKEVLLYGGTYGRSLFERLYGFGFPCHFNESGALTLSLNFWFCLGLTALILALSYVAFSRRHMESAGEIVTVSWAKVLFVQGAAMCIGIVLTSFTLQRIGSAVFFVVLLLWELVIAAAALMILQKTYRIKGFIKQAIGCVCVVAVLFAVFELDITGYEKRVPRVDKVESVEISDRYIYNHGSYGTYPDEITDPELIEKVISAHEKIVADRPDSVNFHGATIIYNLKNGSELSRSYRISPKDIETYFGEVMMTDEYKNRCFLLNTDWLNTASDGLQVYFTKEETAQIKTALAKDVAEADFDTLYPDSGIRDDEMPSFSSVSIYVVLDHNKNRGDWLTIYSTMPRAWAAVNDALDAHSDEITSASEEAVPLSE